MSRAVLVEGAPAAWGGYNKQVLTLICPAPYAPGQPMRFSVDGVALEGKSLGSKRQPDGRFEVRLRLVNLRKEHREMLESGEG